MKILHVNGYLSGGGVENYLAKLLHELEERGHRNLLVYGENALESSVSPQIKTFHVEDVTKFHCRNSTEKIKEVEEILAVESPDVVFIHQVYNCRLVELLTQSRPSVKFVHDFKLICPDGRKLLKPNNVSCSFSLGYMCQARAFLYRCMPRNLFLGLPLIHNGRRIAASHRQRSHMIVASEFMKKTLIYNGFSENRITSIPYFTYLPQPTKDRLPTTTALLLSVGRIVREKGMHHVLRAFADLQQDAELTIAGDGPALNDLKNLTDRLGLSTRVSFPGWLPSEALENHYRKSRVVVVPSVWPEPFGIVGIEAMAFEKPVVAFGVGGISDWLKDGVNGFLVRPGDHGGLAGKIRLLLDKPDMAVEMGKTGREMVSELFTPRLHLERLVSVFQQAIDSFTEEH